MNVNHLSLIQTSTERLTEYEDDLTEQDLKQHPTYSKTMEDMEKALKSNFTSHPNIEY